MDYRLVDIRSVKAHRGIDVRNALSSMATILRENRVTRSIVVNDDDVVADEESNILYWSLRFLGVRRVPVSRGSTVEVNVSLEELGFYEDVNPEPYRVFQDTLELLYRNWPTPLVRLRSLSGDGYTVWAKLEWYNPYSMSIKDRTAWYMIVRALEEGWRGDKIYEATSTNTGMALAAMGAIHGFKVKLWIPKSIQKVSDILLKAMGAEVVRRDKSLTVEMISEVKEAASRDNALHIDQFNNDANFLVHLRFTAKELEVQLKHAGVKLKGIVGGLGTSGHMSAITFYFKTRFDNIKVYGVVPAPGEVIPGIRRPETGMKWVHWSTPDRIVDVKLEEAIEAVLSIARKDGILPGLSSGAVAAAFMKLRDSGEIEPGHYVLVFPDNGFKYAEQLSAYFAKHGS
ncbi:Pyridoxal-5'-phosphate-dependent protein beta subunit [Pyrolobus fumarii 1A]|uniref:Pyridoxal-5'-phosphate-dependent protein beta subunit n=1 Tax=Pyrolobus fumarii (strain DSM 11204 / 1A) TaxID=694429 RepID=G0EFF1_PYRF1|nr:PLP-dependent cysteine synthase family protein [Pyrolobus fumarii]AEM38975.1 Pyridoxal-5'-phosphate-dependent protein beta subunit [Pyrolobus fumarii 1A]